MKYDNYFCLEILTPVHIGSGDTSDPLEYVIAAKDGQDYFCQIDLDAWLEDYPDQKELSTVLDGGKLPVIRKYIADNLDPDIYAKTSARVISPEVASKYKSNIENTNSPNQLLIDPALKNPYTGGLLVPGSSIKGAIRTAVIDWCDQNWNLNLRDYRNQREYNQILERALGSIRDSTFKQLKIGDLEAANGNSAVVTAKEKSIKPDKVGGTPKNSCEICLSTATEGNPQFLFGRMSIGKQGEATDQFLTCTLDKNNQSQSWSLQKLMKLVNDFYCTRFQNEKTKFYQQRHFQSSQTVIEFIDQQFSSLQDNQMILRVGRYSHIEAMTITHNKPGGKKGHGKTRTLADGIYPFGWVKLTLCSQQDHDNYWEQKYQLDAAQKQQRQQLRQAKQVAREQALKEQLELQQQRQLAEQQRKVRELDELKNPWKKVVKKLDQISSWGDLKQQILEKEDLLQFRNVSEFTQAVYSTAQRVRDKATKWDNDRDDLLSTWFEPSATSWQALSEALEPKQNLSANEQADVDKIEALKDWGMFVSQQIQIESLSDVGLKALDVQLKKWGCHKKKAKENKRNAWKQLQRLLKERKI